MLFHTVKSQIGAATYALRPLYWTAGGWPTVVPEPSALGVLALAFPLVAGRRVRRTAVSSARALPAAA